MVQQVLARLDGRVYSRCTSLVACKGRLWHVCRAGCALVYAEPYHVLSWGLVSSMAGGRGAGMREGLWLTLLSHATVTSSFQQRDQQAGAYGRAVG